MVTKFEEKDLIENKDLREELVKKVEVLEKVKDLILLPNTEIMTTEIVASWLEVSEDVIRKTLERNKEELSLNGARTIQGDELRDIKSLSGLKTRAKAITVFSKRAVLNVAMLLRDSEVAKRVRTTLLDQQEVISDEQKVKSVTDEQLLLLRIIQSKSEVDRAISLSEYNNHKNRHIAELNVAIDKMKPKVESYEHFIEAKNAQRINEVAKILNTGSKRLLAFLREKEVMMKVKNDNIPYQRYIDIGYFVVKDDTTEKNGNIINYSTTYVTPKGIDWISKLLNKHIS